MARTYRRRHEKHEYRLVLSDVQRLPGLRWRRVSINRHAPEGRRRLARFHSDAHRPSCRVPAEYRHIEERVKRHRENTVCRVIPQHGGGETLAICRKHSVRWLWF